MKKIIFSLLCLSLIAFTSCQKDDAPETTSTKVLGKWRLEKFIDEYYQPVNTLIDREEVTGNPDDYDEFRTDGNVYVFSPTEGNDVVPYQVIDETHIEIEDEVYEIKALTSTDMHLYQDITENDTRFVQNAYFKKL